MLARKESGPYLHEHAGCSLLACLAVRTVQYGACGWCQTVVNNKMKKNTPMPAVAPVTMGCLSQARLLLRVCFELVALYRTRREHIICILSRSSTFHCAAVETPGMDWLRLSVLTYIYMYIFMFADHHCKGRPSETSRLGHGLASPDSF